MYGITFKMDRKKFLKSLALLPFTAAAMKINELEKFTSPLGETPRMPVLFLGHGSPMNAIEENEFVNGWRQVGHQLARPSAVLCVSAHWETRGTFVTAMEKPRTIHDFGGFPQQLFDVQYPAPGSPVMAEETRNSIHKTTVEMDHQWGLDHGSWSVVKHLYPDADVPVLQLSLDYTQGPRYHYELAKELAVLRRKGVLILGSGNMVHNLRMASFQMPDTGYDWAVEANEQMKKMILENDHQSLINYTAQGTAFNLSVPSPDHYLPLLYTLALQEENETVSLFNDKAVYGSIAMTSLKIS